MQPSDAWANEILDAAMAAGGPWTVGMSSTVPYLSAGVYAGITDVTDVDNDRVTVASWDAAAGRAVIPAADLDFGDATDDFVWAAWVLYEDGVAAQAGAITSLSVTSGSGVILPAASMPITIPA